MNDTAAILLLFVAAGLLVLLGVGLGREGGRQPSARDAALMAGMTGVAVGFLATFLGASAMPLGPVAIAALLVVTWWRRGQLALVGAFLLGGGGLVAGMQTLAVLNDLGDPAVSIPGWTSLPLAVGVAASILGISLLLTDRRPA